MKDFCTRRSKVGSGLYKLLNNSTGSISTLNLNVLSGPSLIFFCGGVGERELIAVWRILEIKVLTNDSQPIKPVA